MITSAIVDNREPGWVQRLAFGGVPVAVSLLDAGDVWAATDDNAMLVIERKTPVDFLNTLKEDRLFAQCTKMKEASPWAYVVITGEMTNNSGQVLTEKRQTGWSWESYQGALLTVQELGVMVTHVANDGEFERAVIRLANRSRDNVTIKPARLPSILSSGEAMLASLPGIGQEKASVLIEFCGSAGQALHYLTDLEVDGGVPGIGWNTKVKIRKALRLEPYEFLSVVTTGRELEK